MFSVDHLNRIRLKELEYVFPYLPAEGRVLEIGAGTGMQALALSERGLEVSAIDIAASTYSGHRLFPVQDYDGSVIPFADGVFDLVYSSNTLEHVKDLPLMHSEIARVLKPAGRSVHLMPSHGWRAWTTLSGPASAVQSALTGRLAQAAKTFGATAMLMPHGERGNAIAEIRLFRPAWWKRNFEENGFTVTECRPVPLFYTGWMVLGKRLSFARRASLSRILGAASYLYVAEKTGKAAGRKVGPQAAETA